MMNKSKFTKDIGWKLLSLIIAIGLWFTVINTENPLETRTYTAAIQLQNKESLFERGYVVVNNDELTSTRVTVRLRGQRLALDTLSKSNTRVQAIVDLENVIYSYDGNPVSVPVSIVIPSVVNNSFEILSKSLQSVTVDIQPYVNQDFEVEPVVEYTQEGSSNTGELINAVASPGTITVYGAKSIVGKIASVKATVKTDNVSNDLVITAPPVAYDENGVPINDVTFSVSEVSIRISLDDMKNVDINENIEGTPASGYSISGIYIAPDNIDVAGDESALRSIRSIELPEIDISGASNNIIREFKLEDYLPDGVRVVGSSNSTGYVTVTIIMEKDIQKTITIPTDNISDNGTTPEGMIAQIESGNIVFSVSGTQSDVNDISADDVKAYVDLSGYSEGTYENVPVQIVLPDGVMLVSDEPVYVSVTLS